MKNVKEKKKKKKIFKNQVFIFLKYELNWKFSLNIDICFQQFGTT